MVATHSIVVPRLIRELGAGSLAGVDAEGNLTETDYARVLVLSVGCSREQATLVQLSSDQSTGRM